VVSREALLWFRQAEADLRKALNNIVTRNWDSAAFWSQQAAEKALKALLLNAGIAFRGRNLLELATTAINYAIETKEHFRYYTFPKFTTVIHDIVSSLKQRRWPPATLKGSLIEYRFWFGRAPL